MRLQSAFLYINNVRCGAKAAMCCQGGLNLEVGHFLLKEHSNISFPDEINC